MRAVKSIEDANAVSPKDDIILTLRTNIRKVDVHMSDVACVVAPDLVEERGYEYEL